MSRLMYSRKDDVLLTRAQLAHLPTPAPMGAFHHPYPFADYVNDVHEALDKVGIAVTAEDYAVTKDHNKMFGMMEVSLKGELITADEWNMNIGLRGSHDQRIPRGLVLGTQVIVCSNLCFHGNIGQFKTKQTVHIGKRLPGLIHDAVMRIPEMASVQDAAFKRMKELEFKARWGDAALVDMYRQGAFSAPQLARAIDEWHNPTYAEHASHGWSLWRLLNAGTEALKPTGQTTNMITVEQRTRTVSDYVVGLMS